MPRYFFHTLNGERHRDVEGEVCAGPEVARNEARALFAEVLARGDSGFTDASAFTVLCMDETGEPLIAYTASAVAGARLARLADRIRVGDDG